MYLKSLELTGFKSFAKKATLHFNSPITGIVGPNGSGKSNSAEAFRFVLGEQSIKSLRGKRGEDMIWNGGGDATNGSARANRASVKLVFDNSLRMFKGIDFDEVILERVVHRDNTNEYLLNGTAVRLKDITELLASAHIGATGHHIISQGEADRILLASIRERREMIEDALGLKIYQWKKLESIRKLEKTEENMERVASLRREIAPHIRFLKKQVEKIEKVEELRRELTALYKEYFAREDRYVRTYKEKFNHELVGPKQELSELDRLLIQAKDILTASKNKDKKSDEVITLERKLANARFEKDTIMRELGRIEGEISANKRTIAKEKEKQKKDEFKTVYLKDVEEVIHSIEPTCADRSFKSIEDAKKLFIEVIAVLRNFVARHRSITDSALISESEHDIHALEVQRHELESKLKHISETESHVSSEYNELKQAIEKEKDTNRDAEKEVFRIIARQNEVRHIISDFASKLEIVLRDEELLKRELGEAGITLGRDAITYEKGGQAEVEPRAIQEERRHQIEKIKIRLEDSGGLGGSEVMKEFRETEERDSFLARELEDLEKAKAELRHLIVDLDVRIDVEFKTGILKINSEFKKFFALMFGGGTAELTIVREVKRKKKSDLEDLGDVLSGEQSANSEEAEESPEGLEVNVNLPRKKVKGLMMLSGGERALTSIALLFAISQVNPPPFIILDETDAALDEANSKKYGDMIESLAANSQLILITHNRETMSRAGVLYGVTMGSDGSSKLLSIQFDEAVRVAK